MPYKYITNKGIEIAKQKHQVNNWSNYNTALRKRGSIEVWLSQEVIDRWYNSDLTYDGAGAPELYSNIAIITCHEMRKVYRLPLRQCQGFIDSLFKIQKLNIRCPDYTLLSRRLSNLNINCPRYRRTDLPDNKIAAIAIDSTGLKRFGRDEWHQEKHKVSGKRSWRKLHIAVDDMHYIQGATLTDRFASDDKTVVEVVDQIDVEVGHFTADGAYDKNPVYNDLSERFPDADVVIPPNKNAVYNKNNCALRNRNILEVECFGRMVWQQARNYGQRNYSELAIQRYKRILGNNLQSREFSRQKQEVMIGCGILNKMNNLGMPESCRVA